VVGVTVFFYRFLAAIYGHFRHGGTTESNGKRFYVPPMWTAETGYAIEIGVILIRYPQAIRMELEPVCERRLPEESCRILDDAWYANAVDGGAQREFLAVKHRPW